MLPGGVFLSRVFFLFLLYVFCVMTSGSWESRRNPLDRREELNVGLFLRIEIGSSCVASHVSYMLYKLETPTDNIIHYLVTT